MALLPNSNESSRLNDFESEFQTHPKLIENGILDKIIIGKKIQHFACVGGIFGVIKWRRSEKCLSISYCIWIIPYKFSLFHQISNWSSKSGRIFFFFGFRSIHEMWNNVKFPYLRTASIYLLCVVIFEFCAAQKRLEYRFIFLHRISIHILVDNWIKKNWYACLTKAVPLLWAWLPPKYST